MKYRKITILILFAILIAGDIVHSAPRKRRSRPSQAATKTSKTTSRESVSIETLIQKKDSILSAGESDSLELAESIFEYFANNKTDVDTSAVQTILWAMEFCATHGKGEPVAKIAKDIVQIDSTLLPKAELITALAYIDMGHSGYAYMLARQIQHKYIGTEISNRARGIADKLEAKLPNISVPKSNQNTGTEKSSSQENQQSQ